jgi:hypothetical protein
VVKLAKALGVSCEVFADCDDIQAEEQPPPRKKKVGTRKVRRE